jgi:hypothetical protein
MSSAYRNRRLLLPLLLLVLPVPALHADAPVCDVCGNPITGRYLEQDGHTYHQRCYAQSIAPRCAVCGEPILESRIDWEGKSYHEKCYQDAIQPHCAVCGKVIEGTYLVEGGKNYHPACHRTKVAAQCVVCSKPLENNYFADAWGNPFHSSHGKGVLCPYCGRAMGQSSTGGSVISAASGMRVCRLCERRGIDSKGPAQSLLERTRLRLQDSFPVSRESFTWQLVSKSQLDQMLPPSQRAGNELGLTLETRARRGKSETLKIRVYLLSGLPEWLYEAVSAHELAHVWQHLQGLDDLPLDQAEGSAELAAYLILKQGGTEEGRIKIQGMERSEDPIYGGGFRKAMKVSMKGNSLAQLRIVLEKGKGWPGGR